VNNIFKQYPIFKKVSHEKVFNVYFGLLHI